MSVLKQIYISTVCPILEYGCQTITTMTKTAYNNIKVCHNTALRAILGVPKTTSIDAVENDLRLPPLKVRFSILTAQFIVKVFSNIEHPLHKSLTVASKKDPRVFNKNHWDIKATTLDLLRGSPIPVIQPKPFWLPPWKSHPIEFNFHHPYESKSKLTPKEACQLAEENI